MVRGFGRSLQSSVCSCQRASSDGINACQTSPRRASTVAEYRTGSKANEKQHPQCSGSRNLIFLVAPVFCEPSSLWAFEPRNLRCNETDEDRSYMSACGVSRDSVHRALLQKLVGNFYNFSQGHFAGKLAEVLQIFSGHTKQRLKMSGKFSEHFS